MEVTGAIFDVELSREYEIGDTFVAVGENKNEHIFKVIMKSADNHYWLKIVDEEYNQFGANDRPNFIVKE